ncbi:MAG: LTA synthase family protein [Deltaproteobacteria bacterium]|nr:LTA synthase family protein [Deltaproteobacteria bacterium]
MQRAQYSPGVLRAPAAKTWLILPAIFLIARCLSTVALYAFVTPNGGHVTEIPWRFGHVAWLSETGTFLVLAALVGYATQRAGSRTKHARWYLCFALLFGYAVVAEIDVHLRRWLGLRLNLVFLRHLLHSASQGGFWETLSHFLAQDWQAIALSVVLLAAPAFAVWRVGAKTADPQSRWTYPAMVVVGGVALAASAQLGIAVRKWRMISPWPYGMSMDLARAFAEGDKPPTSQQIAQLQSLVGDPRARNPAYPLWHSGASKADAHKNFDVFLIAVESMRGWASDLRAADARRRLPNLHRLFAEEGVFFPHAHSNGYPSGEGNVHLHLGVWSHPARALAAEHVGIASRSLPEILRDKGYVTRWFAGNDPSFDNLQHFMGRWFHKWEVIEGGDVALAQHAVKVYDELGDKQPRFISVYTASTHPFYELPASEGPKPPDPEQAYLKALTFADRSLGVIFDHVRARGRLDKTLFVITGDHAQPNHWQLEHDAEVGLPNAGRTWTSLVIAGPGIAAGQVREDASSHVDVPPTVLGYLGIGADNHFFGRDLLADTKPRPIVATFGGGASVILGDTMLIGDLSGPERSKYRYDQQNNENPAAYQHGEKIPLAPGDAQRFESVVGALKAFAWLADHDRLRPAE